MSKEEFVNFAELNQKTFETMKKMAETNMRIGEQVMQEQASMVQNMATDAAQAMETMTNTSDINELVAKQSEMAETAGQKMVQAVCSYANIMASASQTYADMFAEGYEAANKAAKTAAKKATKKAA